MNVTADDAGLRARRMRALEIEPLRLRSRVPVSPAPATHGPAAAAAIAIRRLALQPDRVELRDPAIHRMYTALTEAVGKAGLQPVRVCDVAADPTAAVMVFGAADAPDGVPAVRVLRVDALSVLHTDRGRKRLLWERMQALGRRDA